MLLLFHAAVPIYRRSYCGGGGYARNGVTVGLKRFKRVL
jgi:hypothetical protein